MARGRRKLSEQEALNNLKELQNDYTFNFKGGYKGAFTKNLHITCNHGHEYVSTYSNFVYMKARCRQCENNKQKHTEEVALKTLYELEPEYQFKFDEGGYKNNYTKNLHVTCNKGHEYITSYNIFQNMYRCPRCANHKSKPETEIIEYIKTFYNKDIEQGNRKLIKNVHSGKWLEIDIYIPDIKIAIEFNGRFWHSDKMIIKKKQGFKSAKEYHEYKYNACKDIGIHLIHIEEQDFINNKNTILNQLKYMVLYSELLSI